MPIKITTTKMMKTIIAMELWSDDAEDDDAKFERSIGTDDVGIGGKMVVDTTGVGFRIDGEALNASVGALVGICVATPVEMGLAVGA